MLCLPSDLRIIRGSILEYRKIGDDDYWVDDSNSAYYNKWVNTSNVKDWNSAEDLKAAHPFITMHWHLTILQAIPGRDPPSLFIVQKPTTILHQRFV